MTHILALSRCQRTMSTAREFDPSGRFAQHKEAVRKKSIRVQEIENPGRYRSQTDGDGWRIAKAEIWTTADAQTQLHLVTQHGDLKDLIHCLSATCHQRMDLQVQGDDPDDWSSLWAKWEIDSGTDVHQMVSCSDACLMLNEGLPTARAERIVYREFKDEDEPARNVSAVLFCPPHLNARAQSLFIHGRGVSLYTGQVALEMEAVRFVFSIRLFGLARLRRLREDASRMLLAPIAVDRSLTVEDSQKTAVWLTSSVRQKRIRLTNEVVGFLDGSEYPEIVLDDARMSMDEALGLPGLLSSTTDMLETLSQVAESLHSDVRAKREQARAAADSRWSILVAVVSAVTVPVALLLGYFGVNSEVDLTPSSSIFNPGRYWGAWTVALLVLVFIAGAGLLVGYRNRRDLRRGRQVLLGICPMPEDVVGDIQQRILDGADTVVLPVLRGSDGKLSCSEGKKQTQGAEFDRALDACRGRALVVLDLHVEKNPEEAVEQAVDELGYDGFSVMGTDSVLKHLAKWRLEDQQRSNVRLGLKTSLDAGREGQLREAWRRRWHQMFPRARFKECSADFIASEPGLARFYLLPSFGSNAPIMVRGTGLGNIKHFRRRSRVWLLELEKECDIREAVSERRW